MIDWTRLNGLRKDIGEEDFADVAFLFVAEITEHLDRLRGDPTRATPADFHFLRGSAANMGLLAMVDACRAAEVACDAGTPPDIATITESFALALSLMASDMPGVANAA